MRRTNPLHDPAIESEHLSPRPHVMLAWIMNTADLSAAFFLAVHDKPTSTTRRLVVEAGFLHKISPQKLFCTYQLYSGGLAFRPLLRGIPLLVPTPVRDPSAVADTDPMSVELVVFPHQWSYPPPLFAPVETLASVLTSVQNTNQTGSR